MIYAFMSFYDLCLFSSLEIPKKIPVVFRKVQWMGVNNCTASHVSSTDALVTFPEYWVAPKCFNMQAPNEQRD